MEAWKSNWLFHCPLLDLYQLLNISPYACTCPKNHKHYRNYILDTILLYFLTKVQTQYMQHYLYASTDVLFLGLISWTSGFMILVCYRTKSRDQNVYKNKISGRWEFFCIRYSSEECWRVVLIQILPTLIFLSIVIYKKALIVPQIRVDSAFIVSRIYILLLWGKIL